MPASPPPSDQGASDQAEAVPDFGIPDANAAAAVVPPRDPLLHKAELEIAMLAAPADAALRAAYFTHLTRLAATHTGLLWAQLPELPAPLAFRAGTPDIAVLAQVFHQRLFVAEFRPTPLRILVIGAYAGYLAVDLARRHPRATLLCAEPLADNVRLLGMNTAPWPQIRVVPTAVWHTATGLAPEGRYQADWSVRLSDEPLTEYRTIPSVSVPELLDGAGWDRAEMIVCDASGAEREIFTDPFVSWLIHVDVLMVRLHEALSPGATASVERCFTPAKFERRMVGDMALFVRKQPRRALPPGPPVRPLLRQMPGLAPFALADVPQAGWGFFVYDGVNCQLHPNPPGHRPSRAIFMVPAEGHERFTSGLTHAGLPGCPPVRFIVTAQRADGHVLGRAEAVVAPRQRARLSLALPEPGGPSAPNEPFAIVLQTEMVAGAPHNQMAWARWLEPRLA